MNQYEELARTGLSYRELAKLIGINHMTVYKLVKGAKVRLQDRVKKLIDPVTPLLVELADIGKLPMAATEPEQRAKNVERIRAYLDRKLSRVDAANT